ncbi:hypothetical protein AUW17_05280 [Tenacibaculum dicentrarchi]|nr:hypothetical protein AUW17_03145 [Tenacibaculum dicentrarchi]ALU74716.1 hypothetical protein AUW17_05280 [Tenacibaculum dicentrarchi]
MILNFKAMSWCFENDIKIFPKPMVSSGAVLKLVLSNKGIERISDETYSPKEYAKKTNELYTQIYNKNNKS